MQRDYQAKVYLSNTVLAPPMVPLLHKPLRTGNECPHIFRDLYLCSCEALERYHLLSSFEPSLDDLPLTAYRYASHFFHLCGRVPLLLHGIQRTKSQPYDAPLLIDRLVDPADDHGVRLRRLQQGLASGCILSWWLLHLNMFALAEVHYLGINIKLSSGGLRLGHYGYHQGLPRVQDISPLLPPALLRVLHGGCGARCQSMW
jgi:hypothetical protein